MKRLTFILTLLISGLAVINGQQPISPAIQQQVQSELEKRGVTEAELRERLLTKGVDPDRITPEQLPRFQQIIEETIAELEAEKKAAMPDTPNAAETEAAAGDLPSPPPTENPPANAEPPAASPSNLPDQDPAKDEIYGHHLFENQNIAVFRKSDDVKAPDNYLLGPGDQLVVSIFGASLKNEVLEVSRQGFVEPGDLPRIYVNGLTLAATRELLEKRYGQRYFFSRNEFTVTLNYSRSITVNIVGEVKRSGSYTLPAINTAINALMAADGLTDIASVRQIKLIRSGSPEKIIDLYGYLNDPTIQQDLYMQDNDYLFVPIAQRTVTIRGAVNRPYIFELLPGEQLNALLKWAGGLKNNAALNNIQIRRYANDQQLLIDVNLRELQDQGRDFNLNPGDVIVVPAIPTTAENVVSIQGSVDFPGEYAYEAGLRLSDLLARGRLSLAARRDIAYLLKRNVDGSLRYHLIDLAAILANPSSGANTNIEPGDQLIILSQRAYIDAGEVSVTGAVRDPRSYPYNAATGLRVSDLVVLAGGLTENASSIAYLYRQSPRDDNHIEYIRLNIQEIVRNPSSSQNISLLPNDDLRIYTNDYFKENANVYVAGAVRNPGDYRYDPTLTLTDVLLQAGGLTIAGATNRIEISRVLIKENEPTRIVIATVQIDSSYRIVSGQESSLHLEPYDQIFVRTVPDFELQQNISIEGEVTFPGTYTIIKNNERLADIIARAGGLTPEAFPQGMTIFREFENVGHVITRLDEAMRDPGSNYNIVLKAGDRIMIPKTKDLVTIEGATKARELYPDQMIDGSSIQTAYQGTKSAKWYIDNYAAGVGENGSKKSISVRLANGQLKKTTNLGLFKIYPKVKEGSTVRVATKPVEPPKTPEEQQNNSKVDWGKVLSDSLAQATSLLTLILLLQRIN